MKKKNKIKIPKLCFFSPEYKELNKRVGIWSYLSIHLKNNFVNLIITNKKKFLFRKI